MESTLRLLQVHATTPFPCRNIADHLTLSTYNHAFHLIYCNTIIHCLFVSILVITRYHAACFTVYLPKNLPHLPLFFFFCRKILPQWGNWGYWKNMETQVRSYYWEQELVTTLIHRFRTQTHCFARHFFKYVKMIERNNSQWNGSIRAGVLYWQCSLKCFALYMQITFTLM